MTKSWTHTDHAQKDAFQVPSGYFETLTERVMQRIQEEERQKTHRKKLQIRIISYAVAATAALFLLFGAVWVNNDPTPQISETAYEDTYIDDMVNYAMLDYYTIDDYIQGTDL